LQLLAPERNVAALYSCLRTLIQNPAQWAELQAAGRHRIELFFDSQLQAERLLFQYKALVTM